MSVTRISIIWNPLYDNNFVFSLLLRCNNFCKSKYKLSSSRFIFSAFRCVILSLQLEFGEARPLQIEVIS